jgi:hypothetical protein
MIVPIDDKNSISCKKESVLTAEEKKIFAGHLESHGLSDNIWDLFGEWVRRSTPGVNFFYLKVYNNEELIGLGLFLKIKPVDLRSSYAGLRKNPILSKIGAGISALSNNCAYISFRNLITCNTTRPFFHRSPELAETVLTSMLTYLRNEKEAAMVTIVDTMGHDGVYLSEGFTRYASSSEASLDVAKYTDIAQYLGEHKNLRKNLARYKITSMAEVRCGLLSAEEIQQIKACFDYSVQVSNVNNPCQKFFEQNIFDTEVYTSDKYIHIFVRVDGVIAGFHTFQVSGCEMGGVLGGFNRNFSHNNFLYERVIIASLEYSIANGISRVHYSLIDNYTKLRLVESREACGFYFYSRNPMNRKVFDLTYRFNDIYKLYCMEQSVVGK